MENPRWKDHVTWTNTCSQLRNERDIRGAVVVTKAEGVAYNYI
jgi:hypothetical protein